LAIKPPEEIPEMVNFEFSIARQLSEKLKANNRTIFLNIVGSNFWNTNAKRIPSPAKNWFLIPKLSEN